MYRGFVYVAFLALCSAAPMSDWNSPQTFDQQPLTSAQFQQQEHTDLVDTLGAGYSFFKKQPIGSRSVAQQKLAISEQQVPITSLSDTSNQWVDYTKASAFKQPLQTQVSLGSNDLLTGNWAQQQDATNLRVKLVTKDFPSEQSTYGSSLTQVQPQPLIRNLGNGYGQQQQQQEDLQLIVKQKPLIRTLDTGYGQQQEDIRTIVKPVVRTLDTGYGQQQQQEDLQLIVKQKPLIRTLDTGYGQQQEDIRTVIKPVVRTFDTGYGQQQQQDIRTIVKPVVRTFDTGYGQQQQEDIRTIVKPVVRTFDTGYGQQQQDLQVLVKQQPMIRTFNNGYGEQQQQDIQTIMKPAIRPLNTGFSQQQQDLTFVQPQQPITRPLNTGFGQQRPQDLNTAVQQPVLNQQPDFVRFNTASMPKNTISQSQMNDDFGTGGW